MRMNINFRQWHHVVFTKESGFQGERFHDGCIESTVPGRGRSVMIWGGIHYIIKIDLRFCITMSTSELTDILQKPYSSPNVSVILAINNAHPNKARSHYLEEEGTCITRLPWPALNHYIGTIEHIWNCIDRHLQCLVNPPGILHQLEITLSKQHITRNLPMF